MRSFALSLLKFNDCVRNLGERKSAFFEIIYALFLEPHILCYVMLFGRNISFTFFNYVLNKF